MKPSRFLLLFGCIVLASLTGTFALTVEIDGINYDINAESQTAVVVHGNYSGDVSIMHHITYLSKDITVTKINYGAFDNTQITSLTIDDGVTIDNLPTNCPQLTDITLPSTQEAISGDCNCPKLTSIVIPEGLKTIYNGTFRHATALTSITLPSTITSLGIIGSEEMNEIMLADDATSLMVNGGWVTDATGTVLVGGLYSNVAAGVVIIPDGIEHVQCSFSNLTINHISLPETLKQMPYFWDCNISTIIRWPESITTIDKKYFSGHLKGLVIPPTVTAIREYSLGSMTSYDKLQLDELIFEDGIFPITAGCLFADFYDTGLTTFNSLKRLYLGRNIDFAPEHTTVTSGSITWDVTDDCIFGTQYPEVLGIGKYFDCENSFPSTVYRSKLDTLAVHKPMPPFWNPYDISGDRFMATKLIVPIGSKEKFENNDWWGKFWEILEKECAVLAPGDVTGNDIIDVDDVNEVISMILNYRSTSGIADLDGSGIVDIDDVNALINYILSK